MNIVVYMGGAGSPSNTMWSRSRPTSMPILIHPTVWPQYTNVTDRQTDRQTGQDRTGRQSDSIGRTIQLPKNLWQYLQWHSRSEHFKIRVYKGKTNNEANRLHSKLKAFCALLLAQKTASSDSFSQCHDSGRQPFTIHPNPGCSVIMFTSMPAISRWTTTVTGNVILLVWMGTHSVILSCEHANCEANAERWTPTLDKQ